MVVKVYISGISGNKEVKKRQQRVLMILDSRNVKYDLVDIAEPDNEEQKDFMQNNSTSLGATVSDTNPRHPLPPQIFNDITYCGDYDQFDLSNEIDELEKFLKLVPDDSAPTVTSNAEIKFGNGDVETEHKVEENESAIKGDGNVKGEEDVNTIKDEKEPSPVKDEVKVEAEQKTDNKSAEETNGISQNEDGEQATAITDES